MPGGSGNQDRKKGMEQKVENCLIINLLGRRIGFKFLKARLEKLWSPKGELQYIDIGNNFSVVKFGDMLDYNNALQNGPWMVADH